MLLNHYLNYLNDIYTESLITHDLTCEDIRYASKLFALNEKLKHEILLTHLSRNFYVGYLSFSFNEKVDSVIKKRNLEIFLSDLSKVSNEEFWPEMYLNTEFTKEERHFLEEKLRQISLIFLNLIKNYEFEEYPVRCKTNISWNNCGFKNIGGIILSTDSLFKKYEKDIYEKCIDGLCNPGLIPVTIGDMSTNLKSYKLVKYFQVNQIIKSFCSNHICDPNIGNKFTQSQEETIKSKFGKEVKLYNKYLELK